jgi:serine protease Do
MTLQLRDDIRLSALQIGEQGYGRLPIPDGSWFPIREALSLHRVEQRPLQPPALRNLIELMVLRIRQRAHGQGTPYLPLDLSRWRLAVGEQVLALGYADLDRPQGEEGDGRPFRQHLWGSLAPITQIEPAHPGRARPWPLLRVDADWPSGMSGGPVFNQAGHVIGLVSAGFQGEGGATATYFSGWDMPERILGSIDRSNPGRFRCYGVFDDEGELAYCGQEIAEVERVGAERGLTRFDMVSIDPHSGEWMRGAGIGTLMRAG